MDLDALNHLFIFNSSSDSAFPLDFIQALDFGDGQQERLQETYHLTIKYGWTPLFILNYKFEFCT